MLSKCKHIVLPDIFMKTFLTLSEREPRINRKMQSIRGDWLNNFASRATWQTLFVTPRNNGKFLGAYLYFNFWIVIKYIYGQVQINFLHLKDHI